MKSLKQWLSDLQSDYRLVNKLHLLYVLVIFFNSFTFVSDNKIDLEIKLSITLSSSSPPSQGITVTIFGVSMEDIRMLYGSGPKVMPLMMISQSGGYVLGTLIGPLYRWLNRQLVMATFALVLAFTTTFIPLYNPILVAFAALALQGVCMGVYASSFQIWFKQMFTGRLNTLLNVNQLCYGLGTAAAPIIAASYLFGSKQVETGERRRSVMIPFVITGVLQATAAAVLYLLFLTNRYYEPVEEEKEEKKRSFGANQQSKISSSSRLDHPHPHSLDECNNNNNNIYCLSTETMVHPSYSSSQATLSFSSIAESKDDSSSSRCAWRKTKLAMCTLVLALYYTSENGYLPYCSTMWQNLPIELSPADAAHVQTVCYDFDCRQNFLYHILTTFYFSFRSSQ